CPDSLAERGHLADAAGDVDLAVQKADPGRVVAAVLEPFEAVEEKLLAGPRPHVSDDPAHQAGPPISAATTSERWSHSRSHSVASMASTMTRTTGSVPDARRTTRPSSPSFASAARTSCQIRSAPSRA